MSLLLASNAAAPRVQAAGCPSKNSLSAIHCYGSVTVTCVNNVATYNVQMSPGYKCAQLTIYASGTQTVVGNLSGPAGWSGTTCNSKGVNWSVSTSSAASSAGPFKVTFNGCGSPQAIGLHVVPIGAQHPYVPPGIANTFHAYAGCLSDSKVSTWGQIRGVYR